MEYIDEREIREKLNEVNVANKYMEDRYMFYLEDNRLVCERSDGEEYEICPADKITKIELNTFELHLAFYVQFDTSDVDEIDGDTFSWWCSAQRGFEV